MAMDHCAGAVRARSYNSFYFRVTPVVCFRMFHTPSKGKATVLRGAARWPTRPYFNSPDDSSIPCPINPVHFPAGNKKFLTGKYIGHSFDALFKVSKDQHELGLSGIEID